MAGKTRSGKPVHPSDAKALRTDPARYLQLRQDLEAMESVANGTGTLDQKTEEDIKLLQRRIEKAEIAEEIEDLKHKHDENKKGEDNHG